MFFDVIWKIYFVLLMLFAVFPITLQFILKLLGLKSLRRRFINHHNRWWARQVILSSGSKVHIKGAEDVPEGKSIIFVSNHQSLLDIPLLIGFLPRQPAFIAKKELKKVPILSTWMQITNCLFLDRKSPRHAVQIFNEAVKKYHNGQSLLIFPEGTRGTEDQMRKFKKGSMKLAFKAEAIVVPVTIDGTRRMFEINGHKVKGVDIHLHLHPPIDIKQLTEDEKKRLHEIIQTRIETRLHELK